MSLFTDLQSAINRNSAEKGSNTPDFILAEYLVSCLRAFDAAIQARELWYGIYLKPGASSCPCGRLRDCSPDRSGLSTDSVVTKDPERRWAEIGRTTILDPDVE